MKIEQNGKHRNTIRLLRLISVGVVLLMITSVVNAANPTSVITLITARLSDHTYSTTGDATFSSVSADGLKVAFDSTADDLTTDDPDPHVSNIFLSVDDGGGNKTLSRIAGWNGILNDVVANGSIFNCNYGPNGCNSSFPVVSRNPTAGNPNSYDIVFSSSAKIVDDNLSGLANLNTNDPSKHYIYKSIFLAKVDPTNPANPLIRPIQRVSVGTDGTNPQPENGNSGYLDHSLLTSTNVLHPVADVYDSQGLLGTDGKPVDPAAPDVNGANAGDAVVVFESDASNLVTGDTNTHKDIFLRNMGNGSTTQPGPVIRLTNKGYDNNQPNGDSSDPVITDDGRYVAFVSTATNLVNLNSKPSTPQVYLLDIATHTFYMVSRDIPDRLPGNGESRYPSIIDSTDGSIVNVAFHSTSSNLAAGASNGIANIYVYRLDKSSSSENLDLVSRASKSGSNLGAVGDMDSLTPYLSSDGGAVTFSSYADNLVEGANNYDCLTTVRGQQITKCKDIYTIDLTFRQTWRVSLTAAGEQAQSNSAFPALSGDGRFVSFTSYVDIFGTGSQTNHMQVYQRDQGVPLGNPVIQPPSSWNFFAQKNQQSIRTFTVTSLSDLTQLVSKDGPYTGLILDQTISHPDGPDTHEVGTSTDNFAISLPPGDSQNSDYCMGVSVIPTDKTCTFQVIFTATDMTPKNAILYVAIHDDRQAIEISLQGQTIVSYLPLMFMH